MRIPCSPVERMSGWWGWRLARTFSHTHTCCQSETQTITPGQTSTNPLPGCPPKAPALSCLWPPKGATFGTRIWDRRLGCLAYLFHFNRSHIIHQMSLIHYHLCFSVLALTSARAFRKITIVSENNGFRFISMVLTHFGNVFVCMSAVV